MAQNSFITVLIAEDNEVSRELMAGILKTQGYRIVYASDGSEAIEIIQNQSVDMALVDINMAPKGGFEFVKYLLTEGIRLPVVIVTADNAGDILSTASSLGVSRLIQKPIDPDRLLKTVHQVLKRAGLNPDPLGVEAHNTRFSPEDLMKQALELARDNVQKGRGGPFGALVAGAEGNILGEGVNGTASRADPTAHAEVLAIRQAAEKLGKTDLSGCILYCSSEPTEMGKALIRSVGINKVYFGLTHAEMGMPHAGDNRVETHYEQLGQKEALGILEPLKQKA